MQHHAAIVTTQTQDRAADCVENSREDDLNIGNVGIRGAAPVGDRTNLVGTRRLSENGYLVSAAGRHERGEREGAVGLEGEIVAAVVLQDDAAARFGEAGNRAADGDASGSAGHMNLADVGIRGASAVGYGASLRWS